MRQTEFNRAVRHVQRRAGERYDVELTEQEVAEIARMYTAGDCENFLRLQRDRGKKWYIAVRLHGKWLFGVFDRSRNRMVTLLRYEWLSEELRKRWKYMKWAAANQGAPSEKPVFRWHLRAPDGAEYRFDNISSFIRDHADYFRNMSPASVAVSLGRLRPNANRKLETWQGWTLIHWRKARKNTRRCAFCHREFSAPPSKNKIITCGREDCHEMAMLLHGQRSIRQMLDANQKAQALPEMQPDERCLNAKDWSLCAPDGTRYTFRNLAHWVRTHTELFTPEDLEPCGKTLKAIHCLGQLRPGRKYVTESWHGWKYGGGKSK